jgi:chromosome segregation ATPase
MDGPVFEFSALPVCQQDIRPAAVQHLRHKLGEANGELLNARLALGERQAEVSGLKQQLRSLRKDLESLKVSFDDCQERLLDQAELQEALDKAKTELQQANLRIQASAHAEARSASRAKAARAVMLTLSEQGARSVIMWANANRRLVRDNLAKDTALQEATSRLALCPTCKDAGVGVAFAPCGHCSCASCADRLLASGRRCPICRASVAWTLRLFL